MLRFLLVSAAACVLLAPNPLRAQEEADDDEGGAEQQAHDHDTSVGLPVGGVKRCGHKG